MAWVQRNIGVNAWIWLNTDTNTEYDKDGYNYFGVNKKGERNPNYIEKEIVQPQKIEERQEKKQNKSNDKKYSVASKNLQTPEPEIKEGGENNITFNESFFKSDLEINKEIIQNYLDIWLNDVKNDDEQLDALVEDLENTSDEHIKIAIANEILLNRATRKKNPPSIQDSLLDPYFFFCTDDNLTYISNKDINIKEGKKRIIPFTSARAGKLRFEDSGDNKFELNINNGKLIYIKKVGKKIDNSGFSIKSKDLKTIDEILQERNSKTSGEKKVGVGDISKLIQKEQNKIMSAPADGTTLITGVAGSGKTNVLLHRIQYLLWEQPSEHHIFHKENMIFLCFNKALQRYIESSTKDGKFPSIIVKTIDQWIIDLFRETFKNYEIKLDKDNDISFEEIKSLVDEFIDLLDKETLEKLIKREQTGFVEKHGFMQYELNYEPKVLKIITKEKSIREYTKKHLLVWCYLLSISKVIQDEGVDSYKIKIGEKEFQGFSRGDGKTKTRNEVIFIFKRPTYDHIFIDEVQDLSKIQMKIVDGFHKNSMTIAGDESQLVMVSQLGNDLASIFDINIDYKYELKTSHRNSQQTALFANEFLIGIKYKHTIESISFKGLKPLVKNVNSTNGELEYLVDKISTLQSEEPNASICVMYPKKTTSHNDNGVDGAIKYLRSKGIDCYNASGSYWDFKKKVHVTNYHQAKGLEFDYVFICGINDFDTWNIKNKNNLIYTLITRGIKRVYIPIIGSKPGIFNGIDESTYIFQ